MLRDTEKQAEITVDNKNQPMKMNDTARYRTE